MVAVKRLFGATGVHPFAKKWISIDQSVSKNKPKTSQNDLIRKRVFVHQQDLYCLKANKHKLVIAGR